MVRERLAVILVILFALQVTLPFATGDSGDPDFDVVDLTISEGGAVDNAGAITLAPGDHTISFKVRNYGTLGASLDVNLYHWTTWDELSPASTKTLLQTVSILAVAPGATSTEYTISITGLSTGANQRISAEIVSDLDINANNDEESMDFEVALLADGEFVTHDIPNAGSRVSRMGSVDYHATALNTGVMPINAVFEITMTKGGDPAVVFTSSPVTLEPGTLATPAQGIILTTTVTAASMPGGDYNVEPKVIFSYASEPDVERTKPAINPLTLSNFMAELIVPVNRAIEPGATTQVSFTVENTGATADSYTISASDSEGWGDYTGFPISTDPISSDGGMVHFDVPVTIPASTTRGLSTLVTATVVSVSSPEPMTLVGLVTIVAGDQYSGTLVAVTVDQEIFPDITKQVELTLTNAGSPSGFTITAGLTTPSANWDIDVVSGHVGTLDNSGSSTVLIDVTPPALTNPLDPALRLRAGDTVTMWMQVTPDQGGLPSISSFQFDMMPVITVDPALTSTEIVLSEDDVRNGINAFGFQHTVDIDITALHNLHTTAHLDQSLTADFTTGTLSFTPKTDGGGPNATTRWGASVAPSQTTTMKPGDTDSATLSIMGPSDKMPLAGTLTIPVVATPTLNGAHLGLTGTAVSHDFVVHIPEVASATIDMSEPQDIESGVEAVVVVPFENTGNDVCSYIVSLGEGIPDDWNISLTGSGVAGSTATPLSSTTITNLEPEMSDHPTEDGRQITDFTLTIDASLDTPADTLQEIPIRVQNAETGLYILDQMISVRIQERVDMTVEAADAGWVNLTVHETPFTRVYIHNTGNVLTNYHVVLDETEAGDVDFEIDSAEVLVAAGYNNSIIVHLTPAPTASADTIHKATIVVSTDTGLSESVEINASITADHKLTATVDPLTYVVPGGSGEVSVELTNSGNLIENVVPEVIVDDGWTAIINPISATLAMDETTTFTITVTAPTLDGSGTMQDGDMHTLTVTFLDVGDNSTRAQDTGKLVVSALFDLETANWDDDAQFMWQSLHTYSPTLTNTGNSNLEVDLSYSVLDQAGNPSQLWQLDSGAPTSVTLPIGVPMTVSFSVSATAPSPSINDIGFLTLSIDPSDIENVTGSASMQSTLTMARLIDQTVLIDASEGSNSAPIQQTIVWSHIPSGGSQAAEYELEFCGAQRLMPELSGDDQNWTFEMTTSSDTMDINTTYNSCTGARIKLPSAEAYVYNDLLFKITTPVWPHIYAGDGWELTFRLYHPIEHSGYTQFLQSKITFKLDNDADPSVSDLQLTLSDDRSNLIEGTLDTGSVILRNEGTALALVVTVEVNCGDNVEIMRQPNVVPVLNPRDEQKLTFDLLPTRLDWWDDSAPVECIANVSALSADGDDDTNNIVTNSAAIDSWAPNSLYVFIGFAVMALITMACLRLGLRNEKFRLAAAYAGAISLGLVFHMGKWVWFGPVITIFVMLWMLGITWRSGDEFQLIHEDYQRARKGQNTMYREHHAELKGVRKQLTFILAMPILGYSAIVLGFPPQMNIDITNIVTLLVITILPMYAIRRLLKWMDNSYSELYGHMTDAELAVDRIDRELSDPARLIRKLARYGLEDEDELDSLEVDNEDAILDSGEVLEGGVAVGA